MLPKEQIEQIKSQLISQIESTFPEDKKASAIEQIKSMNEPQLEEFLKKNNLIKGEGGEQTQKCIFCSIVSEEIQAYKIDENKDAIAILEINPISKAHSLIIPREHFSSSKELPKAVSTLAEKVAKRIKTKFKPKEVKISPMNLLGHEIINILPIYKDETLDSEKKQAKPEELLELQEKLKVKEKPKTIKKPKRIKLKEKLWLPTRIP